jgi:hypothetical protein
MARYVSSAILALVLLAGIAAAQSIELDTGWKFLPDPAGSLNVSNAANGSGWRASRAGESWNAQFEDLRDYAGVGWYQTRFEVPAFTDARHTLLKFGAVDYFCEVFINGTSVGTHEGGYAPFSFDVSSVLKPGWNQLLMRVVDPPMDEKENRARFSETMYNEIPHGKQNWYVQTGGIWQPVVLQLRPALYIERAHVTPHVNGEFEIDLRLAGNNSGAQAANLTVIIRGQAGHEEFRKTVTVTAAGAQKITGNIANPQLWSPDQPALYSLTAQLDGPSSDEIHERFGFRNFEARDGKLYLNGEPFYMRAALDQDFYPEGIYTPPSAQYVRDMMLKGKRLGLNMLRCHIKVPDPVYLEAADEVGMLVWYEIPSWNDEHHLTAKAAERGEKIFAEMVERDWNHPSIVIQSIINESWGADLKQSEQRRWLHDAYNRAKELTAPLGRLIVDNSACCENFHVKSDLEDFHQYFSIPDNAGKWDHWTADFASRPKWTFSSYGDAERSGKEPLILSEFGNWGLPNPPAKWPWWYGRDFGGRDVTRPAGVLDRFHEYQYDHLFRDFKDLAEETQRHQYLSLKHEIENIRAHAPIQGYVITEFTDINWEANGLMDMWREPKIYARELSQIQQPDTLLAEVREHNFRSGEPVELPLEISHYSVNELKGAVVLWRTDTGEHGEFTIPKPIPSGSVAHLDSIKFRAPMTQKAYRDRVWIELRGTDGALLAENSYELFIYPEARPAVDIKMSWHDPSGRLKGLSNTLKKAGYVSFAESSQDGTALLIATAYDSKVQQHLQRGGRVLLLLDSVDGLPKSGSLKILAREGSDLDGNWVTNFNWIRNNSSPFDAIPSARIAGFESVHAVPHFVIDGVPASNYNDVLSGIFYGWLNRAAVLALQANSGSGKLFATTFRFDAYGTDPYSTVLLDSIMRYVASPQFSPKLQVNFSAGAP